MEPLTIDNVISKMVVVDTMDVATARTRREALEKKLRGGFFLPFELQSTDADQVILDLKGVEARAEMLKKGYKALDYSFLSWRFKDTRLPAFAVFDAKSERNRFMISVSTWTTGAANIRTANDVTARFEPELPDEIRHQYRDTIVYIGKKVAESSSLRGMRLTAELPTGFVPDTMREQIRKAWRVFDSIFIIAEARMKLDEIRALKGDPLVVGWKKKTATMYLIGNYDPTDLETYVETQFTED